MADDSDVSKALTAQLRRLLFGTAPCARADALANGVADAMVLFARDKAMALSLADEFHKDVRAAIERLWPTLERARATVAAQQQAKRATLN